SGYVMKAKLAALQAGRRDIFRQVGQHIYQILTELEETHIARSRQALFGDEHRSAYELLMNRVAFVENGRDDVLFLEHYVLLGNYQQDPDRIEELQSLLLAFVREILSSGHSAGGVKDARTTCRSLKQ